jgi:putative ABC transport system ATP-binding protein
VLVGAVAFAASGLCDVTALEHESKLPSVCASNLSCIFANVVETVRAVDDVSLTAHSGDFVLITGASGSGKSTLLSLLSGIREPDHGSVQVDGQQLAGLSNEARSRIRLRSIGVVFQDDNLIQEFTAAENVSFPLELMGWSSGISAEVGHWLERVDLSGLEDRLPAELSGGQRQRVGIARALVGSRSVLMADEPTGALDTANSLSLYRLLRDLADEGATVVMASHDPAAREYATRHLAMMDGRVLED